MSLRGPIRTTDSTDCLAEVEVGSERGGKFLARSDHARRKPSGCSNTRFAIHPLRPGTGRAPLGGSSHLRPQLKFAAKLNTAPGPLLSCASCISWFTSFLGGLQIVCNLAPVLL